MVHQPHRAMFNLGFGELAVIFIVLIIAVGPDRLPTMMKGLGKTIRTVRQASRDIRATVGIDELMREDIMAPLPRRQPPKAAVPHKPADTPAAPALPPSEGAPSAAPVPAAQAPAGTIPTENARPPVAAQSPTEAQAGIPGTPSAQPAAPDQAAPAAPEPPRKD